VKKGQQNKHIGGIKIRRARENDIPALLLVLNQAFNTLRNRGYPKKAIEAAIPSPSVIQQRLLSPKTVVFVAMNKDQIIGTVTGTAQFEYLHVRSLAVDPRFQRYGVGYRLMTKLENRAQIKNCNKLFVQTAWAMSEAINLYRRLKFELEGYHPKQFFGEDLLSFGKILEPLFHDKRL
jgi:ribosomal protein S18 acetylase RimI-like enzyme